MNTRKIQKKYYLSEKVAKDSKILSAKVGITESRLVEHAIISELIREAKKGGGR